MNTIRITVEGGCVIDVAGLPEGWNYEVEDLDDPDRHDGGDDDSSIFGEEHEDTRPHGPRCAYRFHGAAPCTCYKSDPVSFDEEPANAG